MRVRVTLVGGPPRFNGLPVEIRPGTDPLWFMYDAQDGSDPWELQYDVVGNLALYMGGRRRRPGHFWL